MPFFYDLSSLSPVIERNPFEPLVLPDEVQNNDTSAKELMATLNTEVARPDLGLEIPARYEIDLMRAFLQDPFHLFVHWQLKDDPFARLQRIFPTTAETGTSFQTVLKLIDETSETATLVPAAFTNEFWFNVKPDRQYRVELGLYSSSYGYFKILGSQAVQTPRTIPSDQIAIETDYQIAIDDYLQVLRASRLYPEREIASASQLQRIQPELFPEGFRQLLEILVETESEKAFDQLWSKLAQQPISIDLHDLLTQLHTLGNHELAYLLLIRHLPELLRRAVQAELAQRNANELAIEQPLALYLAERLAQVGSEYVLRKIPFARPNNISHGGRWLPSMSEE